MKTKGATPAFYRAATFIALLGALNWGLVGLFDWNLVDAVFGGGAVETTSAASRVVYAVVGIAGFTSLLLMPRKLESSPNVRPDL